MDVVLHALRKVVVYDACHALDVHPARLQNRTQAASYTREALTHKASRRGYGGRHEARLSLLECEYRHVGGNHDRRDAAFETLQRAGTSGLVFVAVNGGALHAAAQPAHTHTHTHTHTRYTHKAREQSYVVALRVSTYFYESEGACTRVRAGRTCVWSRRR
jgi:hypothetical protein